MTKKRVVVRSPETDRLLLQIPSSLTDLDDYSAPARSTGYVYSSTPFTAGPELAAGSATVALDSGSVPDGASLDAGAGAVVLGPDGAGFYLITLTANWSEVTTVPVVLGGTAASEYRALMLYVDSGYGLEEAANFPFATVVATAITHTDQVTFMLELPAAAKLQMRVYGWHATGTAQLQFVRIAP